MTDCLKQNISDRTHLPHVSILVICWNNSKFLGNCFSSIRKQSYKNLESILIDNNSSDNSIEFTKNNYPEVRILSLENNLGFAEGNNKGIELVLGERKSDFLFILNPDTTLEEKCIEELIEKAKMFYTFGSFSPKIKMMENPSYLNSGGGDCIFPWGDNLARAFYFKDDPKDDSINKVRDIFGMSGAASFLRTDMLREIGFYWNRLFTYYEDVDLNFRIQLSGWNCLYVPSSIVYHYQGGTLDDFNPFKIYLLNRNKYLVLLRNLPTGSIIKFGIPILFSFKNLSFHLIKINQKKTLAKIIFYILLKFPQIVFSRYKLFKKLKPRPTSQKYIQNLILEHEQYMTHDIRALIFKRYHEDLKSRHSKTD